MTITGQPASEQEIIDTWAGPTLEVAVTEIHTARACDMWQVLGIKRDDDGIEIRVKFDWNDGAINARNWDQSFVPWQPPKKDEGV